MLFQPETLKPEELRPFNMAATKSGATRLLTDPLFMGLTFHGGFGMASFFVFIASASFVSAQGFGLSPTGTSLAFRFMRSDFLHPRIFPHRWASTTVLCA